ncbi:MAG TPA: hypothetical protein VGL05_19635 [Kribbella sp.]
MSTPAEHLSARTTDRGFDHYPTIPGAYGGEASVYESSAASGPHVWLNVTESPLHLTAENATKLAEQLLALVANHYQNDGAAKPTGLVCSNCEATTFACTACGAPREEY